MDTFLYGASKVFTLIYCWARKLITFVFNNDGLLSSEKPWLKNAEVNSPQSFAYEPMIKPLSVFTKEMASVGVSS